MSNSLFKNVIVITGASSGIGQEFAFQLDSHFSNVDEFWLIGRNRERLNQVAQKLKHKARILVMDITKEAQIERLEDTLKEYNANIRILVNSAGFGIMGDFAALSSEEQLNMVRLNCEALTHVTHRCIPFMKKNSRIIQMASSAAFLPQQGFAVYAATKSYILSFSRALGEELKNRRIYVTSVCPGPVDTPFFDVAETYAKTLSIKKYTMVNAHDVVKQAIKDSYYKRAMSVYSVPIYTFMVLSKLLPQQFLMNVNKALRKYA